MRRYDPPASAGRLRRPGGMPTALLLGALAVLAVGCWLMLLQWYALADHAANPRFDLGKAPGRSTATIVQTTLGLFLALSVVYPAGYLILRQAQSLSLAARLAVVALVAGPALLNVALYPVGALDVFNYLGWLKVTFHYHQNPYLVLFTAIMSDPIGSYPFLPDVPLFYGPAWLLLSGVPTALVGFADPVRPLLALKVANLAFLLLTALALQRYYRDERRGWLAAYLFLANPLVLFEGVGNAHNDVLMTLPLVIALLALRRGSSLALPLLVLSALVKFFTAALAPLFLVAMLRERWGLRRILVSLGLALVLAVGLVAPFWAGGDLIAGLRRATVTSQEMNHVSLSSLARQYLQAHPEYHDLAVYVRLICAGIFGAALLPILWAAWRGRDIEGAALDVLLLFTLLLTLLYPWYLVPLFALFALRHDRQHLFGLFAVTTLGLAYYPFFIWAWGESGLPAFALHRFLACFLTLPLGAFLAVQCAQTLRRPTPV